MDNVITQMVTFFFLMVTGYIMRRCNLMSDQFNRDLSIFIIQLTCPCLIVSSVMGGTLPGSELILPLLVTGVFTYAFFIAIAAVIPRFLTKDHDLRGVYAFMLVFGNVGFIGYPLCAALFGIEAVFYATMINFANTFCVFTIGTIYIAGHDGEFKFNWKILFSPAMIASYISIAIVALQIDFIPEAIANPLRLIGGITVPGAMLIIGSSMSNLPFRQMLFNRNIYVISVLRLLLIPLAVYGLCTVIGLNPMIVKINTVLAAMPVATYGTMLCLRYDRDSTVMVEGTFVTTMLSLCCIPVLMLLFT